MEGYFGHIEDICRGAYVIKDIYLNKTDTVKKTNTHKALPEILQHYQQK
jgi:hypothetical protein